MCEKSVSGSGTTRDYVWKGFKAVIPDFVSDWKEQESLEVNLAWAARRERSIGRGRECMRHTGSLLTSQWSQVTVVFWQMGILSWMLQWLGGGLELLSCGAGLGKWVWLQALVFPLPNWASVPGRLMEPSQDTVEEKLRAYCYIQSDSNMFKIRLY